MADETYFPGTVEMVSQDGSNQSIVGVMWTPDDVPLACRVHFGITDLTPVEPERQHTGRTPIAAWTGKRNGFGVRVMLWDDSAPIEGEADQDG